MRSAVGAGNPRSRRRAAGGRPRNPAGGI